MKTENKRFLGITAAAALLMLIPLAVGLLSGEMKWSRFDFAIMGILLFGTATSVELVLRFVKNAAYRIAIGGAVFLVLFIVWVELAVGVFGSRFAGS